MITPPPPSFSLTSKSAFRLSLIAAAILASHSALAAEDVDFDAVTVTATSISTTTENSNTYKSSAMSTTTGLELTPRETPQSVSNVTMQQIQDQGLTTLDETMRRTTGITVIENAGSVRYLSRGFFVDKIQEDGISSTIPGATGNAYRESSAMSDMAIYDHIEVVRGPTGLTQSNGEPGGTINAVRKRPTAGFQANVSAEAGSWDHYRSMADISSSLNEAQTLRGRLVGVVSRSNSFKDSVGDDVNMLYGILEADVTPDTKLTFGGLYQDSEATPDFYGLPTGPKGEDLDFDRDTTFIADWQKRIVRKRNLFAELEHYFNEDWRITSKISYTRIATDTKVGQLIGIEKQQIDNPIMQGNNFLFYDNSQDQLSASVTLNGVYHLFGQEHDFFGTIDYSREESDSNWKRSPFSSEINAHDFSGSSLIEPDWNDYDQLNVDYIYRTTYRDMGIRLGTRYNFTDNWHLIAGARWANFKQESDNEGIDYTFHKDVGLSYWNPRDYWGSELTTTKLIPYFGLTWDVTPNSSLYLSYTSIFKPQSGKYTSGEVVDPVEGKNYEIGIKSDFFNNKLNTSAALFYIEQENRPIWDAKGNWVLSTGTVVSQGLELEMSGEITDGWNLFAGYTYNKSEFQNNESTLFKKGMTYSALTPRHLLRFYTSYRLPGAAHRWTVGTGAQIQSKSDLGQQSRSYHMLQGGYAVWNANVQYRFNDHLDVNFVVNNLFDKTYWREVNNRTYTMNGYYGDPRSFLLRANYRF